MSPPVRILVVDDSATARAALRAAFASDPGLEVVGEAADGATASRLVRELAPDLVTMDLFLRAESGLDVAAGIMASKATPIVVLTAADARDPGLAFRAMKVGVLEVAEKLPAPTHVDYEARRARLVRMLKTLATVPVIHRGGGATRVSTSAATSASPATPTSPGGAPSTPSIAPARPTRGLVRPSSLPPAVPRQGGPAAGWLLVGASTGGPPVIAALLRALPRPLGFCVAIVQHMTPGFGSGFARWLGDDSGHPVCVVDSPRPFENGVVYVANDLQHMVFERGQRIGPSSAPPRGYHRPSVDVLFESAATPEYAARTVAVLLTGMGSDGAAGLRALRLAGARTIAQSPMSCSVSSMPSRAIETGAADAVLDPTQMPAAIVAALRRPVER